MSKVGTDFYLPSNLETWEFVLWIAKVTKGIRAWKGRYWDHDRGSMSPSLHAFCNIPVTQCSEALVPNVGRLTATFLEIEGALNDKDVGTSCGHKRQMMSIGPKVSQATTHHSQKGIADFIFIFVFSRLQLSTIQP